MIGLKVFAKSEKKVVGLDPKSREKGIGKTDTFDTYITLFWEAFGCFT